MPPSPPPPPSQSPPHPPPSQLPPSATVNSPSVVMWLWPMEGPPWTKPLVSLLPTSQPYRLGPQRPIRGEPHPPLTFVVGISVFCEYMCVLMLYMWVSVGVCVAVCVYVCVCVCVCVWVCVHSRLHWYLLSTGVSCVLMVHSRTHSRLFCLKMVDISFCVGPPPLDYGYQPPPFPPYHPGPPPPHPPRFE